MGKYFDMLMEDVRMQEGLTACMNCGICTGVCPAAEFYCYDPRQIVNTVQTRDDDAIEKLLRSDTIWYCGECMSCRPRCPRGNTQNILSSGYCVRPEFVDPDLHPEQGPVWKWVYDHAKDVFERFGDNYGQTGPGACRKIDEQSMEELHSIFRETGGSAFFENIERRSDEKAREMGFEGADDAYFRSVFTANSGEHGGK